MKNKRLILCLLAALTGFAAEAQNITYDTDPTVTGAAIGTIVRSWGTDNAVSYYWIGDQPYLDIESMGTASILNRVLMPTKINLKDMYIDQTYGILYFCGTTASPYYSLEAGNGVLGWLDLTSVAPPTPVQIYWVTLPDVSVVTKLVEYYNGGTPQVVAIGVYHWSSGSYTHTQYYFVECFDAQSNLLNTKYYPMAVDEHHYDIMLTSKYVVLFGYYADPAVDAMCYRKTLRTNIYDPMLDDIHYFSSINEVCSVTNTTSLDDDNILTSYLYIDNTNNNFFTHLRTFDISNDNMTYSQEYYQMYKSAPTGITYIPADKSAVLMHEFQTGGTLNSNFVHIKPFPVVSYTTKLDYFPGQFFHSITTHPTSYYLAGNGAIWFYRDKLYTTITSSCPNMDKIKVGIIDNLRHSKINMPLGSPAPIGPLFNPSADVTASTSSPYCSH